jgi:hypothetical protein
MNFKLFEETVYVKEPQGLLKKSAQIKRWNKIGVGRSGEGFGVYAIDDINDNETVDECPAVEMSFDDIKGTPMMDHAFKIKDDTYVISWGNGSIYNHRNQPNVRWEYIPDKKILKIAAVRPVKRGEELFISYGREYFSTREKNMKS